ncbi:terminase [Microbacterium sp. kSW2-24]|uniref:terminase n=1 Tax=Microbacterium TaxID=33882 RepID=UPI001FFDE06A|nr:terminase [Microbacterium galbinum]MCK2022761.1 terminase [Microbacterium galbinum]
MTVKRPSGLNAAGRKLWDAITADFDLAGHELAQLEEACRVRDMIVTLRRQLADDGTMLASSQGMRLHPAIAEIRQHQLALARLLATLQVPGLEEDALPSSSGARGVYRMRKVA